MSTLIQRSRFGGYDSTRLQSWGSAIKAALNQFGWVKTADTGQIDLATMVNTGGDGAFIGYVIYRMADALQATTPVFMRIEIHNTNNNAQGAAITFIFGFATDGAGNLTGANVSQPYSIGTRDTNAQDQLANNYFSGDTNRFAMMLQDDAVLGVQYNLYMSVSRMQNASGADIDGGIVVYIHNGQFVGGYDLDGRGCASMALPTTGTPLGWLPIWRAASPQPLGGGQGTMQNTSDNLVGVATPIPFGPEPKNPSVGPLVYSGNDFTRYTQYTIPVYGANHTYMAMSQVGYCLPSIQYSYGNTGGVNGSGDGHIMMRWE